MTQADLEPFTKASAPTLTPSEAADQLGIKGAMLRRYASAYETVFGPLPRDERGTRVFTLEVMQRLKQVKGLYHQKAVGSIFEGMDRLKNPEPAQQSADAVSVPAAQGIEATLELILHEIKAHGFRDVDLRDELIEAQRKILELERRNRALVNAIEALKAEAERSASRTLLQRVLNRDS